MNITVADRRDHSVGYWSSSLFESLQLLFRFIRSNPPQTEVMIADTLDHPTVFLFHRQPEQAEHFACHVCMSFTLTAESEAPFLEVVRTLYVISEGTTKRWFILPQQQLTPLVAIGALREAFGITDRHPQLIEILRQRTVTRALAALECIHVTSQDETDLTDAAIEVA